MVNKKLDLMNKIANGTNHSDYMSMAPSFVTMAAASGPASLVLAGPVFTVSFGTAHAQTMNNE